MEVLTKLNHHKEMHSKIVIITGLGSDFSARAGQWRSTSADIRSVEVYIIPMDVWSENVADDLSVWARRIVACFRDLQFMTG